jgi:hypothetical protein
MKKITNIRDQILYLRNGAFTIQDLSELAEPTDIISIESDGGWGAFLYKQVEREETDEEYERRLIQEQYQEDWKKYEELKLKFNIK